MGTLAQLGTVTRDSAREAVRLYFEPFVAARAFVRRLHRVLAQLDTVPGKDKPSSIRSPKTFLTYEKSLKYVLRRARLETREGAALYIATILGSEKIPEDEELNIQKLVEELGEDDSLFIMALKQSGTSGIDTESSMQKVVQTIAEHVEVRRKLNQKKRAAEEKSPGRVHPLPQKTSGES